VAAVRQPRRGSARPAIDLQRESLGYAIKLAQVRSYALLYRLSGDDSLSPGRMTALSMISLEPGINQSALAQRLNITRASVLKVVDALASLGLIERQTIQGDRRSYALVLTDNGHRELLKLAQQADRFEAELASGLTASERLQLIELLSKVAPSETPIGEQAPGDH